MHLTLSLSIKHFNKKGAHHSEARFYYELTVWLQVSHIAIVKLDFSWKRGREGRREKTVENST